MAETKWRFLEKLAACIEQAVAPQGAVVKSPDRLKDRDTTTGKKREVDVSIRYTVGSVEILIIVECRKHRSTQDVRWIEQVSTNKEAVGAHAAIAVSTSGFSQAAQEKAARRAIELREVRSIEDAHVEEWFRAINVTMHHVTYRVVSVGIVWPNGKRPFAEQPEINVPDAFNSPKFQLGKERKPININDLMLPNGWGILVEPPIGSKEIQTIYIRPGAGTDLLSFSQESPTLRRQKKRSKTK